MWFLLSVLDFLFRNLNILRGGKIVGTLSLSRLVILIHRVFGEQWDDQVSRSFAGPSSAKQFHDAYNSIISRKGVCDSGHRPVSVAKGVLFQEYYIILAECMLRRVPLQSSLESV